MAKQIDFIRRFERQAESGRNVLFAAPTDGYAMYWIKELFDYLHENSHEDHKPYLNRSRMTIEYRGATCYFKVFNYNGDFERINGLNLHDWFDPGTLPLLCREQIRTRIR